MCPMQFSVKAIHVTGKCLVVADTLSCNPLAGPETSEMEKDVQAYVEAVIQTTPMLEPKLNVISKSTTNDPIKREVMGFIKDGWPHHVPLELKGYHAEQASLSRAERLLLHGGLADDI